jgi:hypothetical protein
MTGSRLAITPDYPDTVERATEIGWAQGVLQDGRPWLASLWEDDEGDRVLALSYPALPHEDENSVIEHLIAEGLLLPLVDELEFIVAEQRDDPLTKEPVWMIEVLLSNADQAWARPGFTIVTAPMPSSSAE